MVLAFVSSLKPTSSSQLHLLELRSCKSFVAHLASCRMSLHTRLYGNVEVVYAVHLFPFFPLFEEI